MKVFIAFIGYDYEFEEIIGVFSTKEKAEDKLKKYETKRDYDEIKEWEVI